MTLRTSPHRKYNRLGNDRLFYLKRKSIQFAALIIGSLFALTCCTSPELQTQRVASQEATCATGGKCELGDKGPGGGIVFYVDSTDQIPSATYLEFFPDDLVDTAGNRRVYKSCKTSSLEFRSSSTEIGKGKFNTELLASECPSGPALAALNTVVGGLDDWYLPTRDELHTIFVKFAEVGIGNFNDQSNSGQVHCSSSFGTPEVGSQQISQPLGMIMNPDVLGVAGIGIAHSECVVRVVRAF
jgi:hypothetical protein